MMRKLVQASLVLCLLVPARANVAIVRVVGSSLRLDHSDAVEMVSEDIDIQALGGQQLGIVRYHCHFVLHNTAEEESRFQVGFPLDGPSLPDLKDPDAGVQNYQFKARDSSGNYKISLLAAPPEAKREYQEMFSWDMQMKAGETRDLWVDYRLALSVGPHGLRQSATNPLPELSQIYRRVYGGGFAFGYWFGYTTSSGATWKGGRIGHARFTLHDKDFRAGMDGLSELPALGTRAELAEEFGSAWFGGALPSTRVVTGDGYRWEYDDFIPGPKIEYVYGVTAIPTKLSELSLGSKTREQLQRIRQLLLAAYGGVPQDAELAKLVREEFWYRPDPNFREDALDADRKAVLSELDQRISSAKD